MQEPDQASTVDMLREQGFAAHEQGDLVAAERAYCRLLSAGSADVEVMHALAVLAVQRGQCERAATLLQEVMRQRRTPAVLADMGNALSGLGRWPEAIAYYTQAVTVEPTLAAAHLNRGQALRAIGQDVAALESYRAAQRAAPHFFEAWVCHADLARELGEFNDARASYEHALRLRPQSAAALNTLLGLCHVNLGSPERAAECYEKALVAEPDYVAAHINLGAALRSLRRTHEALARFDRVLALDPTSIEALSNRAAALIELGRFEAALRDADRALELRSDRPEIHLNRAAALQQLRHHEAALDSCARALELAPDSADAHFNRGTALQALDRPREALESYERTLALDDGHAEAYGNRGVILHELGQLPEALASFDRAIERKPDYAAAYTNRGNLLKQMNRLEESLRSHDQALAIDPDLADAHFNRSFVLLSRGDYERGFAEYEWRWRVPHALSARDLRGYAEPLWLGETSLEGKTILLHGEQGLGDTLQFCRYVPRVAQRGARVVLKVPQRLERLLRGLPGVARCLTDDEEAPACDYHCPLLSLPLAFRTTVETVPAEIPYLRAEAALVAEWRERLGPRTGPRVGLTWSGGVRPEDRYARAANQRRNMPLAALATLKHSGAEFHSLQLGEPASELQLLRAQTWDGPEVIDFSAQQTDFAQTAALVEVLDLVISVDTSTAHLAGAMGKPVWILNRFDPCWRWLAGRSDSPWYPSARLYAQAAPGDWVGVVQRIAADLTEWVRSHARG